MLFKNRGRFCLKISTKGRYGIRLMHYLASQYPNRKVSLKEVAAEQNISEKYLEQIINPLAKSGLVQSFRGSQGGYCLAKPPEEITIGSILRILEGSLSPVDCADGYPCPRADICSSISLWKKLKEAIDAVVDHYTLKDLLLESQQKKS